MVTLDQQRILSGHRLPSEHSNTTGCSESTKPRLRSGGEGGTTPALAAVINAIVGALSELGVRHIEMPATPERVWRAIRAASLDI
jgi:aerobic carbon-monoxide dehydrogenase large subunit